MRRAGVFVGVDRTGQLQTLNDAAAGAERMHQWALGQGMSDGSQAILLTDRGGKKVTPDMIFDAIKSVIDGPGVDHLLVYFAGHGVNINRSEHWLLSDAPVRTSAAVNVAGSVDLARYCGIPYVVFVSDACRSAPEGIQAQNVRGVDVFPNDGASDRAQPVDQFFACRLGKTAAEIRDPAEAANGFSALYTGAFLDAVSGLAPSCSSLARTPVTPRGKSCRRGFAIISIRKCRGGLSPQGWSGASIKVLTPSSSHTPTGCRESTTSGGDADATIDAPSGIGASAPARRPRRRLPWRRPPQPRARRCVNCCVLP